MTPEKLAELDEQIKSALALGETACVFYCDWYTGESHRGYSGQEVAYELVTWIRQMIAELKVAPAALAAPKENPSC